MASARGVISKKSNLGLSPRIRDYYELTKPEVNLLILITTSAGYYLGNPSSFHFSGLANTLIGTLLVASGTATLNQFMERSYDAQMRRTSNRPVASGRLAPRNACAFGVLLSVVGGLYLWLTVNPLAAALAISTLLSYLLIYTPLKRVTPLCTLLGSIPGAMPTLIGWAGASASLNRQAGVLFAVLFLWQFPHFLAIALMYREDYERAGYKMLPAFDVEGRFTRAEILAFTVGLMLVTVFPGAGKAAGVPYLVAMLGAGAFFLYYSGKLALASSRNAARHLVHASVAYLPMALLAMVVFRR